MKESTKRLEDEVLRRMLNTPHSPNATKKSSSKRKPDKKKKQQRKPAK
jgi:hypothetical protein